MRDIAVLMFLVGAITLTLRRPWLGVLALAIFSYANPHAYAWGFMVNFPAYQALFVFAFIALLISKDRQPLPKDWRITVFFLLWAYFLLTTLTALVPSFAWPKFLEVSKIYAPFLLTLLLITDRRKLHYLVVTIAASIGILAVKGGIWAVANGFNYRVYGPSGTQFGENNAFAIAVLICIPLLILWARETQNHWLRLGLWISIPFCFLSSLSSWSRGALLTSLALGIVLIWHSRRKYLILPLAVIGLYLVIGELPERWFERMHTIQTYESDLSARGRLEAWKDGLRYALSHPLLGSGFEGWRWVTQRDWHNSYIEIMAEHGLVAFSLWFSLLVGTVFSLTRLAFLARGYPELSWVTNYCTMLRASLVAYATGTMFLGLSYWDIFYHIVFISVLVKQFALKELDALQAARANPASHDFNAAQSPEPG